MALHKADREVLDKLSGSIERLTVAIDALAEVLRGRNKQLKEERDAEMESIRLLSKVVGVKTRTRPARKKST